jgi:hypothetical protein
MTEIDGLVFDEETHTYRYEGQLVPGVTTVLEGVGISDFSMVPPNVLAQAQSFGTEVHNATEIFDRGEAIPDSISEATERYLCHYISFLRDFEVKFIEIEKKVFCKKYLYAGTLDRIATLKKISNRPVLYDIKTGQKSISHQIQTAAYEYAYKQDKRSNMDRYTLYLSPDGYKLSEPYKSRQDLDVFLSALSVYNYKMRK